MLLSSSVAQKRIYVLHSGPKQAILRLEKCLKAKVVWRCKCLLHGEKSERSELGNFVILVFMKKSAKITGPVFPGDLQCPSAKGFSSGVKVPVTCPACRGERAKRARKFGYFGVLERSGNSWRVGVVVLSFFEYRAGGSFVFSSLHLPGLGAGRLLIFITPQSQRTLPVDETLLMAFFLFF